MLKFFFRRKKVNNVDIPHNEQPDPYLEKLTQELLLQKKQESVKLTQQQKEKEVK